MANRNIGVLIPIRGDRPHFLQHALNLLAKQCMVPQHIEVVDFLPEPNKVDITKRYRLGCEALFKKGCELVIFWEDDDWYAPEYIQIMYEQWLMANKPDIIGIGETTYYHIFKNKYLHISHPNRASACCTAVTKAFLNISLPADDYAYIDVHLWNKLNGKVFVIQKPIHFGIKHGMGLCGGGGHTKDWKGYTADDSNLSHLKSVVDTYSFLFYLSLKKYSKHNYFVKAYSKNPFLSIITRCCKRPNGLTKNQQSINSLTDKDFEQVFIEDEIGYGMLEANTSFQYVKNIIKGEYVYLLDDDDFIVEPRMIEELKKYKSYDVIFVKNKILTGDGDQLYPKKSIWKGTPKRGTIGGSCFVVKKEIYKKYISHFAKPSFGDFDFITAVLSDKPKCAWLDLLVMETGKVSRGATE